jgi:hypothetical protein
MQNRLVYIKNSADFSMPVECSSLSGFESIRRHLALLPFDLHPNKSHDFLGTPYEKADLYDTLAKSKRDHERTYALFVITRGAKPADMQPIERILAAYKSVTMVIVGGPKPGGRIHSLYVEPGCDAADSLSSLFQ